uniref:Uncharacterized protein n=1 Tax=Anguilla anguilla TaxID=7936 RepID=A0A0E9UR78_ANGAN
MIPDVELQVEIWFEDTVLISSNENSGKMQFKLVCSQSGRRLTVILLSWL